MPGTATANIEALRQGYDAFQTGNLERLPSESSTQTSSGTVRAAM